jgi:hypothetical protein
LESIVSFQHTERRRHAAAIPVGASRGTFEPDRSFFDELCRRQTMDDTVTVNRSSITEEQTASAVSGMAILAGAITNAALTLVLLAFGSAVGFSSVSPWSNAGLSSGTFKLTTGIYLIVAAMLASTVGGYIAGRMRTKWTGLHSEEVLFRDTAHGFLSWALASVLGAALLGAAATYVVGGIGGAAAQGAGQATAQSTAASDYFTDMLLRPANTASAAAPATDPEGARREAGIIVTRAVTQKEDLPATDRAYLAQLVAARTGLSQADADKRISDVITQAKAAADRARKAAAALSMWLTISMLVGAFAASLAAIEGGQLRDGRWIGVIGTRNYLQGRTT